MKKLDKVLSIALIVLMLSCVTMTVFAAVDTALLNSIDPKDPTTKGQMVNVANVILGYITTGAMIIAVVMIAVLGVKYMMGSVEEKVEYKKTLVPLLVGAVLVFGAAAIAKVIIGLASSFA